MLNLCRPFKFGIMLMVIPLFGCLSSLDLGLIQNLPGVDIERGSVSNESLLQVHNGFRPMVVVAECKGVRLSRMDDWDRMIDVSQLRKIPWPSVAPEHGLQGSEDGHGTLDEIKNAFSGVYNDKTDMAIVNWSSNKGFMRCYDGNKEVLLVETHYFIDTNFSPARLTMFIGDNEKYDKVFDGYFHGCCCAQWWSCGGNFGVKMRGGKGWKVSLN